MTGLERSYLAAWTVVTVLLLVTGGVGVLFAPLAAACGLHRAHVWGHVRDQRAEAAHVPTHRRAAASP